MFVQGKGGSRCRGGLLFSASFLSPGSGRRGVMVALTQINEPLVVVFLRSVVCTVWKRRAVGSRVDFSVAWPERTSGDQNGWMIWLHGLGYPCKPGLSNCHTVLPSPAQTACHMTEPLNDTRYDLIGRQGRESVHAQDLLCYGS